MKQWIKIETSLLEDPRIKKLLDSDLGYAGLGIYVALRIMIEKFSNRRIHINQLQTFSKEKAGYRRCGRVIKDFDLFWVDGNGDVSLREGVHPGGAHEGGHPSAHPGGDAPEPISIREREGEIYKEINKDISTSSITGSTSSITGSTNPTYDYNNGNHDFDPRWD